MKIDSIAFGAKYIAPAKIEKLNQGACEKLEVSLIELSSKNKNDVNTVMELIEPWGGFDSYSFDISKDMLDIYTNYKPAVFFNFPRIFALTKQPNNYKRLKSKDILGIAEVSFPNPEKVKLNYIETAPNYQQTVKNRVLGNIGTTLVKAIKTMFKEKELFLYAEKNRVSFYKKMGFKEAVTDNITTFMYLTKKGL